MKKILSIILATAAVFASLTVSAQNYTDEEKAAVDVSKTVTPIGDGSQYLLNLETFVKGEATFSTTQSLNMDIVLCLDVSGSMGENGKLDKLKEACLSFVDFIEADAAKHSAEHHVAIVKFAGDKKTTVGNDKNSRGYNYTQVVNHLTNSFSTVRANINALSTGGPTRSDYAMSLVNESVLTTSYARTDAVKAVVMFTDGSPSGAIVFWGDIAASAINTSKTIKGKGTLVYTVGLFDDDDKNDNVQKYMNAVSSNYKLATATSYVRYDISFNMGQKNSDKYYFEAADGSQLQDIFQTIGEDIVTSNAGINLPVSQVTLKDIITPQFLLPDGSSSITLKVADIDEIGYSGPVAHPTDTVYNWKEPYTIWRDSENVAVDPAFQGVTADLVDSSDGKKSVNVRGFDFSAYWVGFNVNKTGTTITSRTTNTNGKKLIIEIVIQFDPSSTGGGQISTNAPGSGIYVGDEDSEPIVNYDVNPSKVYSPLPLVIVKNGGLRVNESILYYVQRGTMQGGEWVVDTNFPTMTIALTRTSNGTTIRQSIKSLPTLKKAGDDNVFYYYRVTEDNTWSWAHKTAAPVVLTQKLFDNLDDYNSVEFVFDEAPDTAGDIQHAEAVRANEFGK